MVFNHAFHPQVIATEHNNSKTMTTGTVPTVREILIKYQQGIPVVTSAVEYGSDDNPDEVRPIMDKLDTMELVRQYHIQLREMERRKAVNPSPAPVEPAPPRESKTTEVVSEPSID